MKRNRSTTKKQISKRISEGRGQGRRENYNPYLHIQDVPSIGLATRDMSWKNGRVNHLMSKLEWLYFLILEWSQIIIDMREQYPLDLDETIAIAKNLGIRYPLDRKTKEPMVMTTDFLITIRKHIGTNEQARTVKYVKDLGRRTLEKFEIERVYWTSRNIDWGIVTERDINPILAFNLEWVHSHHNLANHQQITDEIIHRIESFLTPKVLEGKTPLSKLTDICDNQLGLETGISLFAVRYLLANRRWQVDMTKPIQPEKKLVLTAVTPASKISKAGGKK